MGEKARKWLGISGRVIIILFDIYYMLGGSFLRTIFPYRKGLVYLAVLIFGVNFSVRHICKKHSRQETAWMIFLLGAGVLCAYVTGEFTLMISAICILGAVGMDKVMLFRDLLFEKTGFLAVSIIFSTAGIIPTVSGSYERLYSFFGNGMVYRRSLGFSNYNILGLVVFELIVLYILYVWQKQGRSLLGGQYSVLFGIAFCAYVVSGSRTAFLCELLLLAAMKSWDRGWIKCGGLKGLIMTVMVGGSLFFSEGIVLLHDMKPEWYQRLDNILQARLLFIYRYMLKFDISFWGNNTKDLTDFWGRESGFDWISLDCGYAVMMIRYGVALTLLFVLMHAVYLYSRRYSSGAYVLCVMLVMGIYNISENVLVFPTINFSLLYLADVVCYDCTGYGNMRNAVKTDQTERAAEPPTAGGRS